MNRNTFKAAKYARHRDYRSYSRKPADHKKEPLDTSGDWVLWLVFGIVFVFILILS